MTVSRKYALKLESKGTAVIPFLNAPLLKTK